jgi:hypothetical protein
MNSVFTMADRVGACRAMHDIDGPLIAQWFYESLFEKETVELDDIAYALDEAVGRLRATGARPIRWATFLHMGG